MSNIAIIAPSSVPFQIGGAEKFWWGLHKGLSEHPGVYAELIKVPCREQSFAEIVQSYRTFSELDVSHFDMVISSKYPAWMIRHPRHVVYIQHTLRGFYDTYHFTGLPETVAFVPPPLRALIALLRKAEPNRDDLACAFELLDAALQNTSLPPSVFAFPGPLIREVVHFFDRVALHPSQIAAYAAISETVTRREYLPATADVKIIHHPSDILDFADKPGEYIFTASRLTNMKRVHLIVEAMQHVSADIPLRIAGTGAEMEMLKTLAGKDRRIEFLGHVPDAALPDLYSKALFVPFVPYDEDYGLITIEAMQSGKPVVTVHDAGGVCEFVVDGKTGYRTDPTPEALGAAMQRLAADPEHARTLGANAKKMVSEITWKNTVNSLLGHVSASEIRKNLRIDPSRRLLPALPKVLVVSTFSAAEPLSGGQLRLHHLCRELSKHFFVQLLCIGKRGLHYLQSVDLTPTFQEIRLPWSTELISEERELFAQTGVSVDDIACLRVCASDSYLLQCLRECGEDAAVVIASHPYLFPAVHEALPEIPVVYDAHNVELDMKTVVLEGCDADHLVAQVRDVEQACCAHAQQVLCCSEADTARFTELYGLERSRMRVAPNGFDDAAISFVDSGTRQKLRKRLGFAETFITLFVGSWHRPNVDAVEHIIQMAPQLPEIQFLVVGSVCRAFKKAPPNVHLLDEVTDAVKNILLRAANVSLNPMTSGAGTNLKIIESLAVGLETLSTPYGLRGLDDPCFMAAVRVAEIAEFPSLLRQAMATPLSDDTLSTAARCVAERFSWRVIMSEVSEGLSAFVRTDRAVQ